MGRRCSDVFRASMCETDCALRRTLDEGVPVVNRAAFIVNAEGNRIPVSVSTALLKDASGATVGGAETFRDLTIIEELRKEILGRHQVGDIVSRSPSMRHILQMIPLIAESESTVLLTGETGTGKELAARAIHSLSARKNGPFVAVNCGALPDTLLESELFGYKSGAFTGATKDKPGRFSLARGGTLFLDEIGEISQAMQVRLLRVIQERLFEPLGSTKTEKADVRIVVATNRNLETMVAEGKFRHDLYYRINVMMLHLPPLRDRKDDIPLLVQHFISLYNSLQNKDITGVSPDVLGLLMAHHFPGNVRELQNIIEHSFVLVHKGQIEVSHLPEVLVPLGKRQASSHSLAESIHQTETEAILAALERCGGNRLEAARELGMHKSTFFRKVKALGLQLPRRDGRGGRF